MDYIDVLKEAVEKSKSLTDTEFQEILEKSGLDKMTFDEGKYRDNNVTIILPNEDLNNYLHENRNSFFSLLLIAVIVISYFIPFIFWLHYPKISEMQLFIMFWKNHVISIICMFLIMAINER